MGTEVNNIPERNDHLTAQQLAAWLSAASQTVASPTADHAAFDEHLHTCAACRAQLVMLQQATQPDSAPDLSPDAEPEFTALLKLGEQAALSAHREAQPAAPAATSSWRQWLFPSHPVLRWSIAAALLLVIAFPVYRVWQNNQPVERAMASLLKTWTVTRPLEVRVTGGFPYLPYSATRGSNDATGINQYQLRAANADLTREVADRPSAKAQHVLSRLHLLKGEFAQAEEQLTQVVKAEPSNALAYVDLAVSIYERGIRDAENSIATLNRAAVQLEKAIELSPQLAEAWFNLAICHEELMMLLQAKKDWGKYLELDSNSPWAQEARTRLQRLNEKTTLQNDLNKTSSELKAAFDANEQTKLQALLNDNFYEVAALIYGPLYDEYITNIVENKQPEAQKTLQLLSLLSDRIKETKGDYFFSDLVKSLRQATPARINDIASVRVLIKQGNAAYGRDNQAQALQYFLVARQRAVQIADVFNQEIATIKLSNINLSKTSVTPEIKQAREWLLTETKKRHHLEFQSIALLWSANIFSSDQLFAQVIAASKEALGIAQRLNDRVITASSLRMSAGANSNLGNYQAAFKESVTAARALWQQPPSAYRAYQAFSNLADMLEKSGNYQAALNYQLEVKEYSEATKRPQFIIHSLASLGAYYSRLDRHQEAVTFLNQALTQSESYNDATGKTTLLPSLYYSLGSSLLKQGQVAKAESAFQRVITELGGKSSVKEAAVRQGLALAYLRQGKVEQAEQELVRGIRLTEEAQKNLTEIQSRDVFFASRIDIYHTMIGLQYFQRNSSEQAYNYAEISRSRELQALLTGSVKFQTGQISAFLQYSRDAVPLTLKEVQRDLPPRTQLVEYVVLEDKLLIWVITAEKCDAESVSLSANALQQLTADYLTLLTARGDINRLNKLSGQLYGHLIAPIAKYLHSEFTLAVVPDGSLQSLPFAALYNAASERYLVQDFSITVNPSANVLVHMSQLGRSKKRSQTESLLTLSNPQFNADVFPDLKPIPRTETEVAGIRSYYPVHLGLSQAQATRSALLKNIGNYEIVHLATHSVTNPQNPLLSTIVLTEEAPGKSEITAGAIQQAGLQAREIFGLKLNKTRLVILSSCQSAVNLSPTGNGFGSLSQAFFSANVPTVVASLWNVDDGSTAELMQRFHQMYREKKQSFSASLQQAQLKLINSNTLQWHHPYYWAAFITAGDAINT